MKRLSIRLLVALLVTTVLAVGMALPASAGTLTGASFTAPAGWTVAGAKNARYDWGFTTATSATLSKVTASVPAGTGGGNRYLALNANSDVSTPDSGANSIIGEIDIRTAFMSPILKNVVDQAVVSKYVTTADQRSWTLRVINGTPALYRSTDGANYSTSPEAFATVGLTTGDTSPVALRATFRPNIGGGVGEVRFFTKATTAATAITDASGSAGWVQLGATLSPAATAGVFDSSAPIEIGAISSASPRFNGKIYYAEVRNGISGMVVNRFDPNEAAPQAPSSWASSTGETWTINRSGTNLPADIATDLSVGPVEGLPSGGTANYRFIDGVATYNLPTATAIPAGRAVKLNLGGFTNTATAGSYTSTITTYDNTGPPPAAVDSATTSALAFTGASSTTAASAVVDPSLTFTVSGRPTACDVNTPTAGSSSSGNAVNLGRISASGAGMASQTLDVSTNAANGFEVFVRSQGPMSGQNGYSIADLGNVGWANQAAFPALGTEGFGYTMSWFNPNTWSGLATYDSGISGMAGPGGKGDCIAYRAQAGPTTPAGSYSTTVIYTAVARY